MTVTFTPSAARGTVSAPPSKSDAHRALIAAALSDGCVVKNLAFSKDIEATATCLNKMGAVVEKANGGLLFGSLRPENIDNSQVFDCFESGSTLRFLLPLCMLSGKEYTFVGSGRLLARPLSVYEEICRRDGIRFENNGKKITVAGRLKGGDYSVPGNISSQFITGLLFALPLCENDSRLTVTGAFESASYVDITLGVLRRFGIEIGREGNVFSIKGGQTFRADEYTVEGDWSNAAFLDAFNLLGGNVTVTALSPDSAQGDRVYREMFARFGTEKCPVFDLSDCPDLAPLMFSLAAFFGGARFVGTKRLALKESDRGETMKEELSPFGAKLHIFDNEIVVECEELHAPTRALYGQCDHRVVMALSVLCSRFGGTITGAEAVEKSFPDFFSKLKSLTIGLVTDDTQ